MDDPADLALRIAMLQERARRAFKLPASEDATEIERLEEIERVLTDLRVQVMSLAVALPGKRVEALERFEAAVLENEKRRGIVSE